MAEQVNLEPFTRGDTWTNKFTFKDANGAAIDITGDQFWLTLKQDPEALDADADAQVTTTASGGDAAIGIVYVTIDATTTADLTPSTYFYDVQRKTGSNITTVMYGKVKVLRDITRSVV